MFKQIVYALMAFSPLAGFSQLNNPYTVHGIGEANHINNAMFSGYGDANVSYAKPSVLNTSNPASYSFLKYQFPIFSVGTGTRIAFQNEGGNKSTNSYTGIPEIAIGLSFAKRFGLAAGIKPFTSKDYSFTDYQSIGKDSIQHKYIGSGSINQIFLGLSVNILNFDRFKWGVGANLSGLFGQLRDERQAKLMNVKGALAGIEYQNNFIGAFHYEFGSLFQTKISENDELTIGAYYQPQINLAGKTNTILMSSTNPNEPATFAPISETGQTKVHYVYGSNLRIGGTYSRTFKHSNRAKDKINTSLWTTSFDFGMREFANNRVTGEGIDDAYNLNNTTSIHIGTEYTPQVIIEGANVVKFFKRSTYRFGFTDKTLPYSVNNNQMKEWSFSFGMGMPMMIDRRMESSLQFSIGTGKRFASDYSENVIQFNVGIMIAPGFNDRWFVKKKLD